MIKIESYGFLLIGVVQLLLISPGCVKPDAALMAEWGTPKEKCIECHQKDPNFKTAQSAKHEEIHCLECHEITKDHHTKRKSGFENIQVEVVIRENKCVLCHPTDRYSNAGHWQHMGARASVDNRPMRCTDCHTGGHDLSKLNTCSECHIEVYQNAQTMAIGHCTLCHGFVRTTLLSESVDVHPYDPALCSDCHDMSEEASETKKNAFKEALFDPHITKISCAVCHSPHRKEDPGEDLTCKRCHDKDDLDKVMTHTIDAHMEFGCDQCHEPHHFRITASAECKECHSDIKTKVYNTDIAGHKDCSSCHEKNVYSRAIANSCGKCHESQKKLTLNAPEQHRQCRACHKPHDWDNPSESICSNCHGAIVKKSEALPSKGKCSTCHDPHSGTMPEIQSLCGSCHTNVKSGLHTQHKDLGFDCVSCHKQHAWVAKNRAICLECHVDYKDHMDSAMLCNECHWSE